MDDRPRARPGFFKAHGLGNDYLVFEEASGRDAGWRMTEAAIRRVCHPHMGIGADGIVLLRSGGGLIRLRMFNPDGSEFERSGNGLRILAAYLARTGRMGDEPLQVEVGGRHVTLHLHGRRGDSMDFSVEMGRARTGPEAVGLAPAALVRGRISGPGSERLAVTCVNVGNPHLVVWGEPLTRGRLEEVGPFLAGHPALTAGANVQVAEIVGPGVCRMLIWERGVGWTSASGTSACAVAVAAVRRGLLPAGEVRVEMEGGALRVTVKPELEVVLRGPVEEVMEGRLTDRFLAGLPGAARSSV
ncbi:MAG: diaminopimelate epimerase [Gemmatimonadota bacterium]